MLPAYLSIEQIAEYFGISESTFYELKNRVSFAYKKGLIMNYYTPEYL
jgi:transposase